MKKNGMKKWSALVLALLMLLSQIVAVSAEEPSSDDAEYELAVAAIMRDYWNDPEGTLAELEEVDTCLLGTPTIEVCYNEKESMARLGPSYYEFYVYSFKRGNSNDHSLQWQIHNTSYELCPGTLDFVSIEWDTQYADYYRSSADEEFSTVRARGNGIILFNLEDDKMGFSEYTAGTVVVSPIKSGTMEFGSKFVHTYTESATESSTASTNFVASASLGSNGLSLGLSYTEGYVVTTNYYTATWQKWADNQTTVRV